MRKQLTKIALTAGIALATASTLSCSSDSGGDTGVPGTLRKEKISGVSQKGPFAQGATVAVYELNASTGEKGNPLPLAITTDGSGNFKIENVTLASPYIVIEVRGNYFNEVSNVQTAAPITLRAVADVSSKDNVNINVFTHLEYDEVLKQAKSKTFEEAKKAAQKKVLNALGMSESNVNSEDLSLFGSGAGDSLLLAASVLLQGNRSPAGVDSLLDDIINGSSQAKGKLESNLAFLSANMGSVNANIRKLAPSAKVPSLDDINKIVAGMNVSSSSGGSSSSGSQQSNVVHGTPVTYGGETYQTVVIGTQTWMARNLNYNAEGSKCYNDSIAYCNKYGRLYNWETAMANSASSEAEPSGVRGICPPDWHIPSDAEWTTLGNFVGSDAGTKLKSASGWNDYNGHGSGTDEYGFSALPGSVGDSGGYFGNVGRYGGWWSATEGSASYAWSRGMHYNSTDVSPGYVAKSSLYSVRCVQD